MSRVKVRVTITEEIRHSQTVEMSRETYDHLVGKLDRGDRMAGEMITAYLDPGDMGDRRVDDVEEFEIVEELS